MKNRQYKILLLIVKYSPWFLGVMYFICTLLSLLGIYISVLSWLFFISFWPLLILYINSIVFQFCIWHRLPLYYILLCNIMNFINWTYYPLASFTINILIFGFFILLGAYLKNKRDEQNRTSKRESS